MPRPFTQGEAAETVAAITPSLTRCVTWEDRASPESVSQVWRSCLAARQTRSDIHFVIRAAPEVLGDDHRRRA